MARSEIKWLVEWLTDGVPDSEHDIVIMADCPKPQDILHALNGLSAEQFTLDNCSVYGEYGEWYVDYDDYSVRLIHLISNLRGT